MSVPDPLLEQRKTINPYLSSAGLILSRLLWDLQPQSWISRKALKRIKDTHLGEKAVILCNGPSLLKTEFALLDDVYCFGLNKINILFDKSEFRPSCIVAVNPFVIEQNREFFNTTEIPLFLDRSGLRRGIRPRRSMVFLHSTSVPKFARDCSISIFQGHTVTYVALQLAFHMGFQEVALTGCDHSYANKGPANATVTASGPDNNHFDPNYFSDGVKWQLPDLAHSEMAYMMAKAIFDGSGRKLVNATEGGNLEVFERQSLQSFLSG